MKIIKRRKLIQKITIIIIISTIMMIRPVEAMNEKIPIQLTTFSYTTILKDKNGPISIHELAYQKDINHCAVYYLKEHFEVINNTALPIYIQGELNSEKIRNIILNGYPYQTIESLNCESQMEAYDATQIALMCEWYHYDIDQIEAMYEIGERVLNTAKIIQEKSKREKYPQKEKLELIELQKEWKIDGINERYMSKLFEIKSDYHYEKYLISLENYSSYIKIVDEKNQEQIEMKKGEKFKLLIPVEEMKEERRFIVKIESKVDTYSLEIGTNGDESENSQYILTKPKAEWIERQLEQTYKKQMEENTEKEPEESQENQEEEKKEEQNNNIKNEEIEHTKIDQIKEETKRQQDQREIKKLPRTGF